jgi:hypothetical protein
MTVQCFSPTTHCDLKEIAPELQPSSSHLYNDRMGGQLPNLTGVTGGGVGGLAPPADAGQGGSVWLDWSFGSPDLIIHYTIKMSPHIS